MYLDTINDSSTDFKNVLKENLEYPINVRSTCPHCKNKILFEDIYKIIKLPEILVFTIERYI
jgi:ubiquitin C-terminal hydrolase